MPQVQTAAGLIDASALGFTLMHEHVFVRSEGLREEFPRLWEHERRVAEAVEALRDAKAGGVETIVDLTVMGLGRDVALVRDVARDAGMQVVVATGLYTYNEIPHHFQNRDIDHLADCFVADIESGIQGSEVRAGIIKCATDEPGLTPGVEKVLRAAARAHRRTGAPISTHTHAATKRGLDQQRIFAEEGVDLRRVVIGHCGDSTDLEYLETLMRAGSTIGMDRFGLDTFLPTAQRVATVAALCERGYAGQMVLAHDTSCYMDWFPWEVIRQAAPNWNFLYISKQVIPDLRAAGVTEDQVRAMMVENPRRIFEAQGAY